VGWGGEKVSLITTSQLRWEGWGGEGRGKEGRGGEKVSLITTSQLRWDVVKNPLFHLVPCHEMLIIILNCSHIRNIIKYFLNNKIES
jgi:hypothetical protein